MRSLVIRYSTFAALAISVNLLAQFAVSNLLTVRYELLIALICGTAAGLMVKFLLDKRYIFEDHTLGLKNNLKKFGLYSIMGLLTTAIFWGVEIGFHILWDSPGAKYVGGFIGLVVGYSMKYWLDKKFVFTTE